MGKVNAGVCPKCGSTNTWIVYKRSRDGYATARAVCDECGFEDARLRGDGEDRELLVELAKKSFSTVYLGNGSAELDAVVDDISKLVQIICKLIPDCGNCPIHLAESRPDTLFDEGGFADVTRLGITCRCQYPDSCRSVLLKTQPGLQALA